jgi:hypothetical protein
MGESSQAGGDGGRAPRQQLDTLVKDYDMAAAEIRIIVGATDRLLAIGLGAIGAGVSYGLGAGKNEVFLVLPVLLASLFTYAALNHHNIAWLGGHRRFLEDRINVLYGDKVLIWEHVVGERGRWNIINLPLVVSYATIGIVVVALSIRIVFLSFPRQYGYVILGVVGVLSLLLLGALREWSRAAGRAYSLAAAIYDGRLSYRTDLPSAEALFGAHLQPVVPSLGCSDASPGPAPPGQAAST